MQSIFALALWNMLTILLQHLFICNEKLQSISEANEILFKYIKALALPKGTYTKNLINFL